MVSKFIIPLFAFVFLVVGTDAKCSEPLPQCSDKGVIDTLGKIIAKQDIGMALSKISGIATTSRDERFCTCIASITVTNWVNLDKRELPIKYEIYLSDDGTGYTVSMSRR